MNSVLQVSLLPCGYIAFTADGVLVEANTAFTDLLGLPDPLPEGTNLLQLLTISSRIYYTAQLSIALSLQRTMKEVALDLLHRSGSRVPVIVNATVMDSSSGAPPLIHMAVFGASERRRHEHEVTEARKRAERVAELVHRSSDAVILVSPDGIIEGWNKGAAQIFGREEESALKRSFVDLLFPAESKKQAVQSIMHAAAGSPVMVETIALHSSGHEIAVSIHFNPHIEPPGRLTSFSAVIRDITAQKLSQRALIANEKLASVGRLASSIVHEINNPLESVTNLLYILDLQIEDADLKGTIQTAQEELARISEIARHTLRFHRHTTDRSRVDVPSMIASILLLYKAKILDRGVSVELQQSSSATLLCHDGELRQVISNLVSNALDAVQAGGRVIVRYRDTYLRNSGSRGTRITIADTGSGIAAEHQDRVFEPFFTTKGIAGSGLGLWITKELVAKNNGEIGLRSSTKASRSGTVFVLFFPNE